MAIREKAIGWVVTAVGLAFIGAMTLVPQPTLVDEVRSLPNTCLVCGDLGLQDVILNVLLFVPLGVGLCLARISRWKAVGIAFLITFAVESLQYTVIVGRHASLSDLLTNTAGGWVGFTLAKHRRGLLQPSPRGARWLAGLASVTWLATQALSSALLAIAVPSKDYFGGWAPRLGCCDEFRGTVLSAALDGIEIPRQLSGGASLGEHLRGRESFALQVLAIGDGATSWKAPIVGAFYGQERELFVLAEWKSDLIFRVRTRAADLRLRGPTLALPHAVPAAPGKKLEIQAGRDGGRLFLQLVSDGKTFRRDLAVSPSWGWSYLIPLDYTFGPEVHGLTMLWIGGLLGPIAYWARRAASSRQAKWQAALMLVTIVGWGLGVLPVIVQFPPVHWSEWVGAAAGLFAGWFLSAVVEAGPQLKLGQEYPEAFSSSSGQR